MSAIVTFYEANVQKMIWMILPTVKITSQSIKL